VGQPGQIWWKKICHSKNKPKVGGQETAFSPSLGAEILTVKNRRTEKATVKISALQLG
jgi:hypothetical protein